MMLSVTTRPPRLARLAGALAVVAVLARSAPDLDAQSVPVWQHGLKSEIREGVVLSNGSLAVLTDGGLTVLAPEDGHELWGKPAVCCFWPAGLTNFVVGLRPDRGAVFDLEHGQEQWRLGDLPIDSMVGARDIPERNLLLAYGSTGNGGMRLVAASLDSGVVRWRQDTLFSDLPDLAHKWQEVRLSLPPQLLLDSDTTFVLFPTRGGVMRLDSRTGALLWRIDALARTEPPLGVAYASLTVDSSVILVPFERHLMAVQSADGKVLWDHPGEFPSRLAQMEITPQGVLVRGYFKGREPSPQIKPFVDLLDPATGRSRWPKPIGDIDGASAMLVRGDTVWLSTQRQLVAIALASGEVRRVGAFKFQGDEFPVAMEEVDGSFLLLSDHNLVGITPSGEVRFQRYYGRPGSSLLSKIADVGLLVGMASAIKATGSEPEYRDGPDPVADPRRMRALQERRYLHILTGAKDTTGTKGFSVVRLEKATGKEVGRVWVNARSPMYMIDGAVGVLYLVRDKTTLEAFHF
jgi:outer membrane protein assembly factor BamB